MTMFLLNNRILKLPSFNVIIEEYLFLHNNDNVYYFIAILLLLHNKWYMLYSYNTL